MNFGEIKLEKELVFFDLETTGLDILKDRIVQIALVKFPVKGNKPEELNILVNPQIPIAPSATAIHGITDEMVANAETFHDIAPWLYLFIGDADLAGYNSQRFDIPLLMEEFSRAGMDFSMKNRRNIDVQTIFHKMEPRTLRAAYKFYCDKPLENAHDALSDVKATYNVLLSQLSRYSSQEVEDENGVLSPSPINNNIEALHQFCNDPQRVDSMNRFKRLQDGTVVFNFGKNAGQPVLQHEPMLKWMLSADFSAEVKSFAREFLAQIK